MLGSDGVDGVFTAVIRAGRLVDRDHVGESSAGVDGDPEPHPRPLLRIHIEDIVFILCTCAADGTSLVAPLRSGARTGNAPVEKARKADFRRGNARFLIAKRAMNLGTTNRNGGKRAARPSPNHVRHFSRAAIRPAEATATVRVAKGGGNGQGHRRQYRSSSPRSITGSPSSSCSSSMSASAPMKSACRGGRITSPR